MCDVNSGDCTGGCRGNWQVPKCNGKECRYFKFYFQVTNYISLVTCLTCVLHVFSYAYVKHVHFLYTL